MIFCSQNRLISISSIQHHPLYFCWKLFKTPLSPTFHIKFQFWFLIKTGLNLWINEQNNTIEKRNKNQQGTAIYAATYFKYWSKEITVFFSKKDLEPVTVNLHLNGRQTLKKKTLNFFVTHHKCLYWTSNPLQEKIN